MYQPVYGCDKSRNQASQLNSNRTVMSIVLLTLVWLCYFEKRISDFFYIPKYFWDSTVQWFIRLQLASEEIGADVHFALNNCTGNKEKKKKEVNKKTHQFHVLNVTTVGVEPWN